MNMKTEQYKCAYRSLARLERNEYCSEQHNLWFLSGMTNQSLSSTFKRNIYLIKIIANAALNNEMHSLWIHMSMTAMKLCGIAEEMNNPNKQVK